MAGQNDITFTRTGGGLDRPLSGGDHISAMVFYTAGSLPSGFSSSDRIKKIFSVQEAEDLGILDTHADETKATGGQVTLTGTWIAGEIIRIEMDGGSLGQFVLTTTTISSAVAGLVAAINANTSTGLNHGYVATDADPIITLVQPAKLGLTNHTASPLPLIFVDRNATDTAASAGGSSTDVQFSSGVGSYFALMHYNISEYFRMQPKGVLYVGIYAQATYAGTEVKTVTDFANGDVRQTGVYVSHESYAASQLTATQTILDTLHTEHAPQNVVFHSDLSGSTLSALASLATLTNERVSLTIGEDGNWHQPAYSNVKTYLAGNKVTFQGKAYTAKRAVSAGSANSPFDLTKWTLLSIALNTVNGFSVGNMGTLLGTVSSSSVHENVGWVAKFDLASGNTLDESAFATGDLWSVITPALKATLSDYNYIYLAKHRGISGTYFSDSWTSTAKTGDFVTIENNRTVDKAERGIRTANLENLSRPLYVNTTTGVLSEDTIEVFKSATENVLIQMQNAGEISGTSDVRGYEVTINPAQDVLATSEISIGIKIVPVGVARKIAFTIGLTTKIAQ